MVREQCGDKVCADYFIGLIEYALYQKLPENPMTNMLITGLKNTIDTCQEKREKAYNKEDFELTDKILAYYNKHPNSSEREVAKAVGCSSTKVHNVKTKYLNGDLNDTNKGNSKKNSNSNLNNNSGSVCQCNASPDKTADAEDKSDYP